LRERPAFGDQRWALKSTVKEHDQIVGEPRKNSGVKLLQTERLIFPFGERSRSTIGNPAAVS
jgi:hypothetical protein